MNLQDQVAVLTGAASGIGRATALALARRGCHLALADIDTTGLAETAAAAAAAHGVTVSQHALDVASRDTVRARRWRDVSCGSARAFSASASWARTDCMLFGSLIRPALRATAS